MSEGRWRDLAPHTHPLVSTCVPWHMHTIILFYQFRNDLKNSQTNRYLNNILPNKGNVIGTVINEIQR